MRVLALGQRFLNREFLIEVIHLAIVDGAWPVVEQRQARRAKQLALAALLERSQRCGQVGVAEDAVFLEHILECDPCQQALLTAQCPVADPGLVLWRIARNAGRPPETKVEKRRLGDRDEPRLDQHLLNRTVKLLDDSLQNIELRRRAGGDDEVPLVVDHKVRALEKPRDGILDRRPLRDAIVDKHLVLGRLSDGGCPRFRVFHGHQGGIFRPKLCRHNEALPQPVKPRLLDQLLRRLAVDHPDQVLPNLELHTCVARNIAQQFAQLHLRKVERELLLQRREPLVDNEVDALFAADVEKNVLHGLLIALD